MNILENVIRFRPTITNNKKLRILQNVIIILNFTADYSMKAVIPNTCLWLVPSHFQQIKISEMSVFNVPSNYSHFVARSVHGL